MYYTDYTVQILELYFIFIVFLCFLVRSLQLLPCYRINKALFSGSVNRSEGKKNTGILLQKIKNLTKRLQ